MKASKVVWWICGLGVGLRFILWLFQAEPAGDDGLRYLSESVNMVRYGVFSTASYFETNGVPAPSAHDLPLWPSIMAVAYWLTDSIRATQYIAGFINILLCAIGALGLISILRAKPFNLSDRQVAVASGVYMFMPETLTYSLCHMPDQLAVTAVIVGLRMYFRGIYGQSRYLCGMVLAFAAAIYAKPICIPLTLALLVGLLFLLQLSWWRRLVVVGLCCVALLACLYPWTVRNKIAFGTSGLTSISGTNLYSCNWGWMVEAMPESKQKAIKEDMTRLEKSISNDDLMLRSKKMGTYAKQQLISHLPEYAMFTIKRHPRLYAGTGTIALLRYLGLDRIFDCLDGMWAGGVARGHKAITDHPYQLGEKIIGATVQIFSWLILFAGYVLVLVGICREFCRLRANPGTKSFEWLVFLCPVLSLILLALVIGPITATRYRFIMIPFFAILSGFAIKSDYNCIPTRTSSLRSDCCENVRKQG